MIWAFIAFGYIAMGFMTYMLSSDGEGGRGDFITCGILWPGVWILLFIVVIGDGIQKLRKTRE